MKTTPKDFFLNFSTMITLYVSVVSLLTLLFQYINVLFPDPLDSRYLYQGYSGEIRLAIASLIIISPLYLFLSRHLLIDIRTHSEKKDLGVHKWLVYLTLFIGSIAIVADLVVLINTFLNGELSSRFIWKVLAILFIVGGASAYYYLDIKGKWEREIKQANIISWGSGIVVLGIIIGGFFIIGTPWEQRLYRFDEQKVNDLSNIQSQVVSFWQDKGRLPKTLEETKDSIKGSMIPTDPQSGDEYTYRIISPLTFELCAVFNKESKNIPKSKNIPTTSPTIYYDEFMEDSWEHGIGEVCFEKTIDPDRFKPTQQIYY